jgi:hypothetical protein
MNRCRGRSERVDADVAAGRGRVGQGLPAGEVGVHPARERAVPRCGRTVEDQNLAHNLPLPLEGFIATEPAPSRAVTSICCSTLFSWSSAAGENGRSG